MNIYLFLMKKINNTISYKLSGVDILNNNYYTLMPYRINNKNLSFILALNENSTKFTFYYYDFSLNSNISIVNTNSFNDMNIQNNMIRCHINSPLSFIKCFFYQNNNSQKYFSMYTFSIKEMNIEKSKDFNLAVNRDINQIKFDKSENNNYFICLTFQNFYYSGVPGCYINKFQSNDIKEIDCKYDDSDNYDINYKIIYLKDKGEFLFVSRNTLITTILNNNNLSVTLCKQDIFSSQYYDFSIIYNNGYQIINYMNFNDHMKCQNISENILDNIETIED